MSISVFPGAVNADLGGYAGSFFQRAQKLVGACICYLISCGDLEALTGDILDREPRAETRSERNHRRNADRHFYDPGHHNPLEPTRVYHRAITPLFAGTAPEASVLSGKVNASRLQSCPTYRLIGPVKHFQYLTAWARVTLPSRKALSARLGATLWEWCEARIEEHTKLKERQEEGGRHARGGHQARGGRQARGGHQAKGRHQA